MPRPSDPRSPRALIRGYVVAGGRSSRMGSDKALLLFRGVTLIEHAVGTLRAITSDVRILCGPTRRYEECGVPVILDDICGAGPIGGLYTALVDARRDGIERIVWLGVDLPWVPSTLIGELCTTLDHPDEGGKGDVVFPLTSRGREPLCAAFRVASCIDAVRAALLGGRLKVADPLSGLSIRESPRDDSLFANVNTPDDFEKVRLRESSR